MTTTESWTVDGFALSNVAYDIATWEGVDNTPELAGDNISVAQAHNQIWTRKFYNGATKNLSMYVSSKNASTGVQPGTIDGSRENYDANLDLILGSIMRRGRLLDVRRTMSSGLVKQADCEVISSITPSVVGIADGLISFDLFLPGSFWQTTADVTSANILPSASAQTVAIFADATAPLNELTFSVTGPCSSFVITDVDSGSTLTYNTSIPALTTVVLNAKDMTITGGSAGNVVHVGEANWLTLYRFVTGYQVIFTAPGSTGATKLVISGRKKYLR